MEIRKKYSITTWTKWNALFSEAIGDFFTSYSYYPNILQANSHTFSQVDFLVNEMPNEKRRVSRKDLLANKTIKPQKKEDIKLSSFNNMKCTVDFALDDKLEDKEFVLIYDSDPDWDDDGVVLDEPIEGKSIFVRV